MIPHTERVPSTEEIPMSTTTSGPATLYHYFSCCAQRAENVSNSCCMLNSKQCACAVQKTNKGWISTPSDEH